MAGCVSVQSAVDKEFHKTISKIYIVVYSSDDMTGFFHDLGVGLESGLRNVGIQSRVSELGPLSLVGPKDIEQAADSLGAEVILTAGGQSTEANRAPTFVPNPAGVGGGYYTPGGSYKNGSKMQLAMYEAHGTKPIWKATVSINTVGFGTGSGSQAARNIIEQMQKDELIPTTLTPVDTTKEGH